MKRLVPLTGLLLASAPLAYAQQAQPEPTTPPAEAPVAPTAPEGSAPPPTETAPPPAPAPPPSMATAEPAAEATLPPTAAPAAPTAPSAADSPAPPPATQSPPAPAAAPAPEAPPDWSWTSPATPEDQEASDDGEKQGPRVPWKGTSFLSSHAVTTTALGVGNDFQSSSYQVYSQGYALLVNYYVHEGERTKLRVAVTPGLDVELTNSDVTTERREVVVRDLPLTAALSAALYAPKDSLARTSVGLNLTTFVATSKYTRGVGDVLTLSPRLALTQSVPVFGKSASALKSFQLGLGLRYDKLFSEADVAVAEDLDDSRGGAEGPVADTSPESVGRVRGGRPLQDGSGNTAYSDVVSGVRLTPNSYRGSAFIAFAEDPGVPVQLSMGIVYVYSPLADVASSEVTTLTGAVELPAAEGRTARQAAGVSAGLTVFPMSEFGIGVGYENVADLDGPTPDLLHTPRAVFTGNLIVSIDAIYERATGPARSEPFVLF